MGRGVSTHRHAVATVFLHLEDLNETDDWDSFTEDLQDNVLAMRYPTMEKCDRWQDREDHVIMENRQMEVSVSEYCGCVAICLAPRDPDHPAEAQRRAPAFERYIEKMFKSCAMRKLGSFSNGESVYERVA